MYLIFKVFFSGISNSILVIEAFLLGILARRGYRVDERDILIDGQENSNNSTHNSDNDGNSSCIGLSVNMETEDTKLKEPNGTTTSLEDNSHENHGLSLKEESHDN